MASASPVNTEARGSILCCIVTLGEGEYTVMPTWSEGPVLDASV